jgi:carboxymethylenebutenolidase
VDHYLSIPASGSGRGVLVLHAWWGLNSFVRRLCDRLADAGYTALAPDLYGGEVAETADDAKALRGKAMSGRREPAYRFLMRKLGELSDSEAVVGGDVALLGLSMGGHWAFWLAQRPELPIAATVTFYACRNGDYSRTRSSFSCHFAESDPWVSASAKRRLLRSFEREQVDAETFEYPGTHHWFFESDRKDAFDRGAARLAWSRTLRFLERRLDG